VPGHTGVDGNETAVQLATQGLLHPFIRCEYALGISAKVASGVIRGWTNRKDENCQSIHGQRQAKGFLTTPSAKRAGELLNLSINQLRIMTGLLTAHCHLKWGW
jgi:hypothetical protein